MPKCPICDVWMKKNTAKEAFPVKGGIASFDAECWKCPACGEEAYDEKQYSQTIKQIQTIVQPMSQALINKAQNISFGIELHFMSAKEREHLLASTVAKC